MAGSARRASVYALTDCDVYTGRELLLEGAVVIEGERVAAVMPRERLGPGVETVGLEGASVAPAFVDAQVNGAGGRLFTATPDPDTIAEIRRAQSRVGTLNLLPTVMSASEEVVIAALEAVAAYAAAGGCGVLGLHLEGPYIDASRAGVHDPLEVRRACRGEVERLLASPGSGRLRLVTASPTALGPEAARLFLAAGVRLSIGHSDATYDEARRALAEGFTGVTHLFNAMSPLQGRAPGVVGAALGHPGVWASVIADGSHVHPGGLLVAKRAMGEKLMLVSDSMPPVGVASPVGAAPRVGVASSVGLAPGVAPSETGRFRLGSHSVICTGGRCVTADGNLAGSGVGLDGAVRHVVEACGVAVDEALRMASTYPARFLGVDHELGLVEPGFLADLVVLGEGLTVRGTVRRGRLWL